MPEILLIIFLIFINGILSMSEIAFVSIRKSKLEVEAVKGDRKAKLIFGQISSPSRFLSTIQIGITLIGILTGVYSGASIADKFSHYLTQFPILIQYSATVSIILVVMVITFLSLFFGELIPKQIALRYPETITRIMIRPILIFSSIMYPFTWTLTKSSDLFLKLFNFTPNRDAKVTEEEIKAIIHEGTKEGEVQMIEQSIVERVFHLGDRKIESLMTHRSDIAWIDVNEALETIKDLIAKQLHTVYPVCDGSLDELLGIVSIKDLFTSSLNSEEFALRKHIKPAHFVLDSLSGYETLELFRASKVHYALVIDEYGTTVGIVTLNDILEALVGDISDSQEENQKIVERKDGTWLIDGQLPFFEFLYEFKIESFDKSKVKYNTIGGFALHHLKRIPKVGEQFIWRDLEFEIVDLDGNRIDKILVKKISG